MSFVLGLKKLLKIGYKLFAVIIRCSGSYLVIRFDIYFIAQGIGPTFGGRYQFVGFKISVAVVVHVNFDLNTNLLC